MINCTLSGQKHRLLFAALISGLVSMAGCAESAPEAGDATPSEKTGLSSTNQKVPHQRDKAIETAKIYCGTEPTPKTLVDNPTRYHYSVIKVYPHRRDAFTQGLTFAGDTLLESTGNHGQSHIAKIDLNSGKVLAQTDLDKKYFGEGITVVGQDILQLTWKSGEVFRYKLDDLSVTAQYQISGEGWGMTHNDNSIINSDGSEFLSYRDPASFALQSKQAVSFRGRPLNKLNELEWVNGCVLANVWQTPYIAVINPVDGITKGIIDLAPVIKAELKAGTREVANGVAKMPDSDDLLITGKYWQRMYQLRIKPSSANGS